MISLEKKKKKNQMISFSVFRYQNYNPPLKITLKTNMVEPAQAV